MGSFTPVPMMAATYVLSRRGGRYIPPEEPEFDPVLKWMAGVFIALLVLVISLALVHSATTDRTTAVHEAEVVSFSTYKSGKSSTYMRFVMRWKEQTAVWTKDSQISVANCPKVIVNKLRPIWYHTDTNKLFNSVYHSTEGYITFCHR